MTPDPEGVDSWSSVAERLARSRSYWLGTTCNDGSPHVAPVWGVVLEQDFYIYSERRTRKAKNLSRDARCVVHLESAELVVIVYGRLVDVGRPADSIDVVEALNIKYDAPRDRQYLPSSDPSFDVLYRLNPERALMWDLADYDNSQQRWSVPQRSRGLTER